MSNENFTDETEIRRFLLGEMANGERENFEARFVADEKIFEKVVVVEDELIEKYLRGNLELEDKRKFEKAFLSNKKRRERLEFTRRMLAKFDAERNFTAVKSAKKNKAEASFSASIIAFFKTPKFAFGAAFALLIAAFGFWFSALRTSENQIEIVRQTSPTPTATVQITQPETNQSLPANEKNTANSNQTTNAANIKNTNSDAPKVAEKPKEQTVAVSPFVALFAGTVRSDGKTNTLNLPKNAAVNNVLLQLNLESRDYQIYRAEITDADGNIVYQSGKIRARNTKINASVPAAKLAAGDYLVKLYGFNSKGETESAADFQLRVIRK